MSQRRSRATQQIPARAAFWLLLLAATVLTVATSPASAQVLPGQAFGVTLAADNSALSAVDGACDTARVTLTNTGQSPVPPDHAIRIEVTQPASGWSMTDAPPQNAALASGEAITFPVTLCPAETTEDGATTRITITATVTSDPNNPQARAQLPLSITANDDRLFGLDVPGTAVWIAVGGVAALIVIVLLTRGRGEGGVALSCPEASKTVAPGRGTSFPIRIRNDGRAKDVVSLATTPVPPGWDTFLPLVDVPLEPREEQTVWLSVKSPEDAETSDHLVVKVTARSSSSPGEQASIDTMTTVKAPERKTKPAPASEEDEESVYDQDDEDEAPPKRSTPSKSNPVAVKRRKE